MADGQFHRVLAAALRDLERRPAGPRRVLTFRASAELVAVLDALAPEYGGRRSDALRGPLAAGLQARWRGGASR